MSLIFAIVCVILAFYFHNWYLAIKSNDYSIYKDDKKIKLANILDYVIGIILRQGSLLIKSLLPEQ